eukprot:TRINITY_DN7635_c0_g1_i1.p1 TRINITY_DN7635_c0_g1~~TRINITY_DN7635_c0_g1_i1.p1  ORF type:complete len:111 (-),score=10.91 TRINITY_DN7635_c0_g1_i1:81-377(-)
MAAKKATLKVFGTQGGSFPKGFAYRCIPHSNITNYSPVPHFEDNLSTHDTLRSYLVPEFLEQNPLNRNIFLLIGASACFAFLYFWLWRRPGKHSPKYK